MRRNTTSGIIAPLVGVTMTVACQQAPGERQTSTAPATSSPSSAHGEAGRSSELHPYVGMWVTADNHIRQELLPNGRYDEGRGERKSAYTGRYWVTGNHIDYADDTGFTADGEFQGDVLHHGGYVFYREGSPAHRQASGAPTAE
ncbi:Atu4866 domain-containing protein [Kibdelosporangium aridum]